MCFGGLQVTRSKVQIYGDVMFKSHFVAFDAGDMAIGLAPHSIPGGSERSAGVETLSGQAERRYRPTHGVGDRFSNMWDGSD